MLNEQPYLLETKIDGDKLEGTFKRPKRAGRWGRPTRVSSASVAAHFLKPTPFGHGNRDATLSRKTSHGQIAVTEPASRTRG